MAKEVQATESYVTCHQTLDLPLRQRVICRGSFDLYKTQMIQLAERLGFIESYWPKAVCELIDPAHPENGMTREGHRRIVDSLAPAVQPEAATATAVQAPVTALDAAVLTDRADPMTRTRRSCSP